MILGYTFGGSSSNEGIFFDENVPDGVLCRNCGTCLRYDWCPQQMDIKPSKKYDASYTHDLREVFSERFVSFCKEVLHAEEEFHLIPSGKHAYYYMMPGRVLKFDYERRGTQFDKPCAVCGGYESVTRARPAFLKTNVPVGAGFFRTDLAFSSGIEKHPLLIVSVDWKEKLEAQKFRGLTFEKIMS